MKAQLAEDEKKLAAAVTEDDKSFSGPVSAI